MSSFSENTFIFELVDGQQRVTSVTDFLDGKFPLPKDVVINGVDVGGLYANQLKKKHTKIYETILKYADHPMFKQKKLRKNRKR